LHTGLFAAVLALGCAPPSSPPATSADEQKPAEAKSAPKTARPADAADADDTDDLVKLLDGDPPAPVKDRQKKDATEPAPAPAPAAPGTGQPTPAPRKPGMAKKAPLPRYFDQLDLTADQVDKMARVAQPYDDRLADLRRKLAIIQKAGPFAASNAFSIALAIKTVTNRRQQALEKLLTDEQRDKLGRLRAASRARDGTKPAPGNRGS
jgi:hypothetical protein